MDIVYSFLYIILFEPITEMLCSVQGEFILNPHHVLNGDLNPEPVLLQEGGPCL
jgi:hypothetical protein